MVTHGPIDLRWVLADSEMRTIAKSSRNSAWLGRVATDEPNLEVIGGKECNSKHRLQPPS